jgi:hypothetical protein
MPLVIWFFAGLLGAALSLSLQASDDEHADHDVHESEQGEAHDEDGVHLTPEQQEMAGVVVETLQLRDIVNEPGATGSAAIACLRTSNYGF